MNDMKMLKYLFPLLLGAGLAACNDEDALTPSGEELFPAQRQSALDDSLRAIFAPYNTVVEYRYVENLLPNNWYSITPAKEEKVLPAMKFLKKLWIDVLVAGSSEEFVRSYFPRMLVLVGSPAWQKDGVTEVMGEAEGGSLVRFTRLNDYKPNSLSWAKTQLSTAFHEYAHILHQNFKLPDEFRNVTPDHYTLNGWLVIDQDEAITLGMVTPYGTSAVSEDFAELFANYVLLDDVSWRVLYEEQALPDGSDIEALKLAISKNAGRVFIRKKFDILKKFMMENGLDIDKVRSAAQKELNALN